MNIAVVFPGQGSQSVGMLDQFSAEFPVVEETFQQANNVLAYDLWDIVKSGPDDKLNQTEITQPAMLAADIAIMRVLQQQCTIQPVALAGHSLGEYAALVAAEAMEFEDAIKLVALRGKLMQSAVPQGEGAMAAIIGLADSDIVQACEQASAEVGKPVEAVNFNSPGQVVIAGATAAVDKAGELCKAAGAKRALPLPVSVPSHSSLMKPAAEELAVALQAVSIKAPAINVIHNVDAATHNSADEIRQALAAQLHQPVQWVKTVEQLAGNADLILECGPGKVLTGLCKRINKTVVAHALATPDSMQKMLGDL